VDLRGRKQQEAGENFMMRSFITCTLHVNFIRLIKSRKMRWEGHVARLKFEVRTKCWPENLKGIDHSENLGVDGSIILEWILGNYSGNGGLDASGTE